MQCPDCKGRGVLELFTSSSKCDRCKGTGQADLIHVGIDRATPAREIGRAIQQEFRGFRDKSDNFQKFADAKLGRPYNLHVEIGPPEDPEFGTVGPGWMVERRTVMDAYEFVDAFQGYKKFLWNNSCYCSNTNSYVVEGILFADYIRATVWVSGTGVRVNQVREVLEKLLENPIT